MSISVHPGQATQSVGHYQSFQIGIEKTLGRSDTFHYFQGTLSIGLMVPQILAEKFTQSKKYLPLGKGRGAPPANKQVVIRERRG